jgi:hypothetical protein
MALERREVPRPLFHLRLFDAASCSFRKGAGSIIATKARVHAASRFLRHADIQVTSMHYADHKERVTVDMDALLHPGNVIAMQPDGQSAKPMVKAQRKRTLSK